MRTVKYRNERREKILALLADNRRMSVEELSRHLKVTGATIRADLEALNRQGRVLRTFGGAVVPQPETGLSEMTTDVRLRKQVPEKQSIGRAAAALVQDGMVVALDASTTSLAMSYFLKNRKSLTLITNSLLIASHLVDSPGVNVILPGGTLRHESSSIVGPDAVAFLSRMEVEYCFMGAHSVHLTKGLGEVSQAEMEVKSALAGISRKVAVLADATKWNRVSASYFWPLEKVDTVFTEGEISREIRQTLKAKGVKLVLAA